MTLGELKALLDGAVDQALAQGMSEEDALRLDVVVRASTDGDYCGTVDDVALALSHDEEETPYLAVDCVPESELRALEEEE